MKPVNQGELIAAVITHHFLQISGFSRIDLHHKFHFSNRYDDVLTLKDDKTGIAKNEHVSGSSSSSMIQGKRYQLYVGNLTWWTTDADIADAVLSLGVNDFLEVKFYENRANGQSKGFCCVSLGSDSSSRTVII